MNTFVCPACRRHRAHVDPYQWDNRACPRCRIPLVAEVRAPEAGFVLFDHKFTPTEARRIVRRIPPDSYHWKGIDTKGKGKVARYTQLMVAGLWMPQTVDLGFDQHPVRFNQDGEITHGVMRLMACSESGVDLLTAVECPKGLFPRILDGRRRAAP